MKREDRRRGSTSGPRSAEHYWVGPEFMEVDEGWLLHQARAIAGNLKKAYRNLLTIKNAPLCEGQYLNITADRTTPTFDPNDLQDGARLRDR